MNVFDPNYLPNLVNHSHLYISSRLFFFYYYCFFLSGTTNYLNQKPTLVASPFVFSSLPHSIRLLLLLLFFNGRECKCFLVHLSKFLAAVLKINQQSAMQMQHGQKHDKIRRVDRISFYKFSFYFHCRTGSSTNLHKFETTATI